MQAEPTTFDFWTWLRVFSQAGVITLSGWIASMVGFVYSILAFQQAQKAELAARSAETAAKEARDQILFKTTAEELEQTCQKTEQLRDYITHSQLGEATLRANEIISTISEFRERRASQFTDANKDALVGVRGQIQVIRTTLTRTAGNPLEPVQKNKTLTALENKGITVLRGILGKIKDEMDQGAHHGS